MVPTSHALPAPSHLHDQPALPPSLVPVHCRPLTHLPALPSACHARAGQLTNKAIDPLFSAGALPKLRELYLTDQSYQLSFNKVQQLLKKRRKLQVQVGETDSDSAAWGMVLQQQGRSYGDGLYGRW